MSLEAARHAVPFFRAVPLNHLRVSVSKTGRAAQHVLLLLHKPAHRYGRVLFA